MTDSKAVKIMIVDGEVTRVGLSQLLPAYKIEVICEASDGLEALHLLEVYDPKIVVMDIELRKLDGYELLNVLRTKYPHIKVLIHCSHAGYILNRNGMLKGAHMVMLKDTRVSQLAANIHTLSMSDLELGKYEVKLPFDTKFKDVEHISSQIKEVHLTKRELEILQFIYNGLMNKEIADKMGLSIRTVESHRQNIHKKTETTTVIDLIKFAIFNNLVNL